MRAWILLVVKRGEGAGLESLVVHAESIISSLRGEGDEPLPQFDGEQANQRRIAI